MKTGKQLRCNIIDGKEYSHALYVSSLGYYSLYFEENEITLHAGDFDSLEEMTIWLNLRGFEIVKTEDFCTDCIYRYTIERCK